MKRKGHRESESLEWIHAIREAHYRATKTRSLKAWLKPIDPGHAIAACRRIGLRVRLGRKLSAKRLGTR